MIKKLVVVAALAAALAVAACSTPPAEAATYNVANSKHAVLVLSVVDTVNMSNPCFQIQVWNGGTTDVFMRLDSTNPTISGDETWKIPPGQLRRYGNPYAYATVVKLISSVASGYSVECDP